jgi:hypothetical protein
MRRTRMFPRSLFHSTKSVPINYNDFYLKRDFNEGDAKKVFNEGDAKKFLTKEDGIELFCFIH